MRVRHSLILLVLFLSGVQLSVYAQDNSGDFCSLFYLKSNNQEVLPFDNDCFTHVTYLITDHTHLEYVGPIRDQRDLFKASPWGITLDLPTVTGNTELEIVSPQDPLFQDKGAPDGKAYLYLSEFKHELTANDYDGVPDFRAISGSMKISNYDPDPEEGRRAFVAYVSCFVRAVENGQLTGPRYNLRFSLVVREDWPEEEED